MDSFSNPNDLNIARWIDGASFIHLVFDETRSMGISAGFGEAIFVTEYASEREQFDALTLMYIFNYRKDCICGKNRAVQ